MARKPSSLSRLDAKPDEGGLSDDQREALIDWLLSGAPYHATARRVEEEFGIETSVSALSRFYARWAAPRLILRRRGARDLADAIAKEASEDGEIFDAATVGKLRQMAFELAVEPNPDHEAIKSIVSLILKHRKEERDGATLKLKVREFEKREEATRETLGDETLSDKEKAARMREAFGIF